MTLILVTGWYTYSHDGGRVRHFSEFESDRVLDPFKMHLNFSLTRYGPIYFRSKLPEIGDHVSN